MSKKIYFFSQDHTDGSLKQKDILGNKGSILSDMCQNGMPIPPGFIITAKESLNYYKNHSISVDLKNDILNNIKKLELATNKTFGSDVSFPLLISVRSGAAVSMPGMMDTILNLGLNDKTVASLGQNANKKFALDSYRRFIQMYSTVVLDLDSHLFEFLLNDLKIELDCFSDQDLTEDDLQELINRYKALIKNKLNIEFPQDPYEQLFNAISAVFKSWNSSRALKYREINNISNELGTSVTIQSMVFGNLNNHSATGVVFTRNPSNGKKELYGEYIVNAQGEDIVAGTRTPLNIKDSMDQNFSSLYDDFLKYLNKLESIYKDAQDVEFTIEDNKLWILQSRAAKRTSSAAIKIAYDLHQEGLITKEIALLMIDPNSLSSMLTKNVDYSQNYNILGKGLPSSPGVATGIVIFDREKAEFFAKKGEKVILVRSDTSPEDISAMYLSEGILTSSGGMTSHAAVVARGIGKPCVSGASELQIDYKSNSAKINNHIIKEHDLITIDGLTGNIIFDKVKMLESDISYEFKAILEWADSIKKIKIRANAETVEDAKKSISLKCEGIGLLRTEHMFFEKNNLLLLRKIIFAENENSRIAYINELESFHKEDIKNVFRVMNGLPVNIRLLDPPLHEFIPQGREELLDFVKLSQINPDFIDKKIKVLKEQNPMLGHRGSRLGISYPELYKMQSKAIFVAFLELLDEGINTQVEIMIPFIMNHIEFNILKQDIIDTKKTIENCYNKIIDIKIGSMMELPSACFDSKNISQSCDYFSFGTNDLTQTTLGLSRDDSFKFIDSYLNAKIFKKDPFISLDENVKNVIKFAIQNTDHKRNIKFGVCGEQSVSDLETMEFFIENNFDYISCSPARIPAARLIAAICELRKSHKH